MFFKFNKVVTVIILLSMFISCSDKQKNNDVYSYSPFFPQKERSWMTRKEALVAPKMSGMIEVNRFVGIEQTLEQKHAADELYTKTLNHLVRNGLFDFDKAMKKGYIDDQATDSVHFTNYDYIFDNDFLNPEKPEYLMFYQTREGYLLAGVMFIQDDAGVHGEQIGGPETIWHFHHYGDGVCVPMTVPKRSLEKNNINQGSCPDGEILLVDSPEMLHLWFVNHPQGRFASSMAIENSLLLNSELIMSETAKAKTSH